MHEDRERFVSTVVTATRTRALAQLKPLQMQQSDGRRSPPHERDVRELSRSRHRQLQHVEVVAASMNASQPHALSQQAAAEEAEQEGDSRVRAAQDARHIALGGRRH